MKKSGRRQTWGDEDVESAPHSVFHFDSMTIHHPVDLVYFFLGLPNLFQLPIFDAMETSLTRSKSNTVIFLPVFVDCVAVWDTLLFLKKTALSLVHG